MVAHIQDMFPGIRVEYLLYTLCDLKIGLLQSIFSSLRCAFFWEVKGNQAKKATALTFFTR
jgi:hypothetical protein